MKRIVIALVFGSAIVASAAVCQASVLYGVTGSGGTPTATLHILSQTDASATPILALSDTTGGQAIAYNPDDGFMYHWAGYQPSDPIHAIYERIDLSTNSVTNIPLSGLDTYEISSATYDSANGVFLTSELNFNFGTVTTGGFRTGLGATDTWVRGLAFGGDTLYGGRNLSNFDTGDAELFTIDPATGATLTTTVVTMDGYNIFGFNGLATDPDTGELWALLRAEGLSRKTRILATIDPSTGVATEVGITALDSGFAGIAFAPRSALIPEPTTFIVWSFLAFCGVAYANRRKR